MTDLTYRDQQMMLSVLTIVHLADTKAELDADTDALLKVAADHVSAEAGGPGRHRRAPEVHH